MTAQQIEQRTGLTQVTLTTGGGKPPSITATGDPSVIFRVNEWLQKYGEMGLRTLPQASRMQHVEAVLETAPPDTNPTTVTQAAARIRALEARLAVLTEMVLEMSRSD